MTSHGCSGKNVKNISLPLLYSDNKSLTVPKRHPAHQKRSRAYTEEGLGDFSCAGYMTGTEFGCCTVIETPMLQNSLILKTYLYAKELVFFCGEAITNHCLDSAFQVLRAFEFQAVFV